MAQVTASLLCGAVVALLSSAVLAVVEDLDQTFKDTRMNDIWLVDFYAPWCGYCKKLEPVWADVGAELKASGSPVRVGKMDATAYSGMSSEFGVRGYPTIKLLKGELAYNYKGPRTKDDIVEFTNRVSGPAVRPLPSKQMFEHMLKRHDVLFVYVGGESPLKEKYIDVATELIVYTYFFSASEEALPESMALPEIPSVAVFKDGSYFTYDEYEDGSLSSWINKERFQGYLQIDGFTLYELGETGKLVAIAVIDDKDPSDECIRLKSLIQMVAKDYRQHFNRDFQFGHMDGSDYINSLIMGLAYGGDGIVQRVKRIAFDARSTIMSVFRSSPVLGCFLFGLPLGVISLMCYGICTADSDPDAGDMELMKREGFTDEEEEDDDEEQRRTAQIEGPENDEEEDGEEGEDEEEEEEEKAPEQKKTD